MKRTDRHTASSPLSIRSVFPGTIVVILVVAMLVALLPGCSSVSLSGAWHNEDLQQLLRFHDDGTVVIRTTEGDFEAKYMFDAKTGQGMISLNDQALTIQVSGDSLVLSDKGVESAFTRGEMDIQVAAATPTPSVEPTPTPETSALPSLIPSSTPTPTPTPTPSSAPASPSKLPLVSKLPKISGLIPGDLINPFLGSIVGDWELQTNHDVIMTLKADMTFSVKMKNQPISVTGTYTYDKTTKKGVLDSDMSPTDMPFTVNGDTMTWQDGTKLTRK